MEYKSGLKTARLVFDYQTEFKKTEYIKYRSEKEVSDYSFDRLRDYKELLNISEADISVSIYLDIKDKKSNRRKTLSLRSDS